MHTDTNTEAHAHTHTHSHVEVESRHGSSLCSSRLKKQVQHEMPDLEPSHGMHSRQHGRCCEVLDPMPEGLPGVILAEDGDTSKAETLQTNLAIRFRILPILQHCTHLQWGLAPSGSGTERMPRFPDHRTPRGPPQQTRQCSSLPPVSRLLLALQPRIHLTMNHASLINGLRDNVFLPGSGFDFDLVFLSSLFRSLPLSFNLRRIPSQRILREQILHEEVLPKCVPAPPPTRAMHCTPTDKGPVKAPLSAQ